MFSKGAGSLTVLKRTVSDGTQKVRPPIQIHLFGDETTHSSGTRGLDLTESMTCDGQRTTTKLVSGHGSKFVVDSTYRMSSDAQDDLADLQSLPPIDSPEALRACSVR